MGSQAGHDPRDLDTLSPDSQRAMSDVDEAVHLLKLGNPSVHEAEVKDGQVVGHIPRPDLGAQVTHVELPAGVAERLLVGAEALEAELASRGREQLLVHLLSSEKLQDWEIAAKHLAIVASQHARAGVSWIATPHAELEHALSQLFGASRGDPDPNLSDVRELADHARAESPAIEDELQGPGAPPTALKTNAGVDLIASNCFGTAVATLQQIALTATATAPSATDTVLAGEIATAGGGLIRQLATYAHTTGTNTATLTVTFTANGSDALPITIEKFGVFNKSGSGGTMGIETALTKTTFNAAGDNATLTETVTIT